MNLFYSYIRNSFWPSGQLAQPLPPRSQSTKMRTRVAAKMLLLTSLSGMNAIHKELIHT
jgi:hypothetical protein